MSLASETPPASFRFEAAAAALLLLWRAWAVPFSDLWRDWFAILCAFWIVTALGGRTRAWPFAAAVTMGGLLLIYAIRQLGPER